VDEIRAGAESIARSTADQVLSTVAGSVPVQSGNLRGSLTTLVVEGGSSVAYDGSARYAGWIEFGGTRGRAYVTGGRWLFPIGQRSERAFVAALEQDASRQIGNFPWPRP
jgi:phage gpG-like protein